MAGVALAKIEDVFTTDGGVLARKLHSSINEGLANNYDTTIKPVVDQLVGADHPLRCDNFMHWDQVILAKANKEWKEGLDDFRRKSPIPHPQVTRYAVLWWLGQLFPELRLPVGDGLGLANEHVAWQPRSRTDAKLNAALETYAMKVAEAHYVKLLGQGKVERVDHIPGALDLLLHCPDGTRRVEVKARVARSVGQVEVTRGEVECSQIGSCILFVVDSVEVDVDYKCSGGVWREYPEWRTDESDDHLKATCFVYALGDHASAGQVKILSTHGLPVCARTVLRLTALAIESITPLTI